jgi:tetratricopeptide (TPR) repeat protein
MNSKLSESHFALYPSLQHHAIITCSKSTHNSTEGYCGMATQPQAQQPQPQRHKGLPWKYVRRIIYILVVITLLFFIAGGIIWVLIQVGIIHASWSDKLLTILAGLGSATAAILAIFGIFQIILSLIPSAPESPTTSPAPPTTIQNIINVPLAYPVPPSPSPTPPDKTSYRGIVGLPPPTDPKTIEQRQKVVKEVYDRLTQPDITAIALTGIGGIGKSTLAALIYHHAEDQRQAGIGPFAAEPLWLTVNPAVTMADLAGTLVEALGKPMLDLGTLSPQNQAAALFNTLNTVDKPRLVTLDQFENFLDWQTGQALPDRVGVGEWLDALNSQPCRCRVLLTSRPNPQGTREYPPTHLQTYYVEGLEEAEGIELLRKQDVTGTEIDLRTAVVRCDGHAYALTLLASLLRARKLSLSTLLKDPAYAELWTGKVAQNLLDSIYKQLDELQRKLLIAFSAYREPVPLEAAQAIIDNTTKVSKAQVESALEALLNQHLLQASGEGRYQLHVIVGSYAQDHFVEGDKQANQQALKAAHVRAAQYYLQQAATSCPPREQRRQISEVHDLVEATWQYCQAEQWQEAYDLMGQEGIFNDLNRWGGNATLLELFLLLLPDKWHPKPSQAAIIYNSLGQVYNSLGQMQRARESYEQALHIYKKARDHRMEGWVLNNLGQVYMTLGQIEQAREYYEEALRIRKKVKDRSGEGTTLNSLASLYESQGNNEQALSYYQQALNIHRELGNRSGEGATLNGLGLLIDSLGKHEQALSYYKQALSIRREVGDRSGEGFTLWNIGVFYFKQRRYDMALACLLLARGIFEEVQSPNRDKVQERIDELHQKVGKKRFATLFAQVEPQAHQIVEQALHEGSSQE